MSITDTVRAYDARATELAARFEGVLAATVHAELLAFLPDGRNGDRLALDVGAGSGRDAAWLVAQGFEVIAVGPRSRNVKNHISIVPANQENSVDIRRPC